MRWLLSLLILAFSASADAQISPPTPSGGMATNGSNATSGAAQNILTAAGSANLLVGGALSLLNNSIYMLGVGGSSNSLHLRVDYSGTGGTVSFDNGPSFNTEASLSAAGGFEIYGTSYSFTDIGGDKTTISNTPSGTHTFTIPNTTGTGITTGDTGTVTSTMLAASAVNLGGSTVTGTLPNTSVGATPLNAGTGATLVAPREYYVCTGACTVTPPVPAAGDEFCIYNDDNVTTSGDPQLENTATSTTIKYGEWGEQTYDITANEAALISNMRSRYGTP